MTGLSLRLMPDSEGSNTEAVLIPVWDFYGTWTSEEPEYKYGNGEDGLVMGDVTMDDAGVSGYSRWNDQKQTFTRKRVFEGAVI